MDAGTRSGGNQLRIARVFQASRERVFAWWSQAEKLQQWLGCKEATRCEIVMDFRVGGAFTQTMQIAIDGGTCEFILTGVYEEIVVPERIVYRANFGHVVARVTVEFIAQGRSTEVVLTYEGALDEFFCKNVSQGTGESFDKLAALVAAEAMPQ
jgi:uncharacterized protein YndB with AHSA1/START domain